MNYNALIERCREEKKQEVLIQSNLDKAEELGQDGTEDFNCWGGTLFVLNQSSILDWVTGSEMEDFLYNKTTLTYEKKKGNILCLYLYDRLEHTAVYIDEHTLWHKKGGNESEYATEEEVEAVYCHDKSEIRAVKKEEIAYA